MNLGEKIKSLRIKTGLNQTQLGLCLFENPMSAASAISEIETGKRKIRLGDAQAIALRLGITLEDLRRYSIPDPIERLPHPLNPNSKAAKAREQGISRQALFQREHPERIRVKGNGKTILFECACKGIEKEEHHPDYSKPLEVVLCCHACHMKEHSRIWAARGIS